MPNPDLEIRRKGGGGGEEGGCEGGGRKKKMGGIRASGWSKNMEVGRALRAPPLDPLLAH